jgi:hypothetical protein
VNDMDDQHKTLGQLTSELKQAQQRIDKEAVKRLADIRSAIVELKSNVKWLCDNAPAVPGKTMGIARPPHSKLSDYTDEGLSRFGDEIIKQGRKLIAVGESLTADLLRVFGEPPAIKALRKQAGLIKQGGCDATNDDEMPW